MLKNLFSVFRKDPARVAAAPLAVSAGPDTPIPFGYKTCWLALKTSDMAMVVNALQLRDVEPANWASGLSAANPRDIAIAPRTFVTPPIGGWVLAINSGLVYPAGPEHREHGERFDRMFVTLAQSFEEALFFATHRVSGFDAWARARGGVVERVFCIADGTLCANRGAQTPEERARGLLDLGERCGAEGEDFLTDREEERQLARTKYEQELLASGIEKKEAWRQAYAAFRHCSPDEEDTVELAGMWSVSTLSLDQTAPSRSVGLVGTSPAEMMA